MRPLVILNPVAGGGIDPAIFHDRVRKVLEADVEVSEAPGMAAAIAAAGIQRGVECLVAAGGDGTVSEVASAIAGSGREVRLGILPIGTGNDLARGLGIPPRLEDAAAVVRWGRARPIDLIEVSEAQAMPGEECRIANAAVGGFCGRIGERIRARQRRRWGRLAYLRAALAEVADLRPRALKVVVDGAERFELAAYMAIVANGPYAGGRVPLAPAADPGDGWLDLVLIHAVSLPRFAALVPAVLRGRHLASPHVTHRRARRVEIVADPPAWWNLDGETWGDLAAAFRVLPAAVRVMAP